MKADQDSLAKATDPVEDRLLDHSYDGILEYDNPMPRWWVWIFWGTFWFSLAYLFHYWIGNGQSVTEAYEAEMEIVAKSAAKNALEMKVSEEGLEQVMADPGSVEAGRSVFVAKCASCHKKEGQGDIGPNLTDEYWIHGDGDLMDIYEVIAAGVPAKGMPEWKRQLTPTELRQVVAYVGTLRGKNLSGRPPQGEPVGAPQQESPPDNSAR